MLNIIALFSKEQADQFKNIDPRYQTVSFNDGLFDPVYDIDNDQSKAVWDLNN